MQTETDLNFRMPEHCWLRNEVPVPSDVARAYAKKHSQLRRRAEDRVDPAGVEESTIGTAGSRECRWSTHSNWYAHWLNQAQTVICKTSKFAPLVFAGLTILLLQSSGSERSVPKPGVKGVQVPYSSIKPSITIKIGGTADWVLVTDDAVWVASTKPYAILRIDPVSNTIVATIRIPGEACSGLAFGFASVWTPVCGKKPALVRIDATKNAISATIPIVPAGSEGGIAASDDSVWMVTDNAGTLNRIDPTTNGVRQKIPIPPGSYNPLFSNGIVWITGVESDGLTAVDAISGKVLASIPVGSKPRFLTAGAGSIWTLNQGDGTVSRVDEENRRLVATIQAGIPGTGGDIGYGTDSVWLTVFDVPITRIDAATNKVVRQWVGKGGDSLRVGFDAIWITDYKRGLLERIPIQEALTP